MIERGVIFDFENRKRTEETLILSILIGGQHVANKNGPQKICNPLKMLLKNGAEGRT